MGDNIRSEFLLEDGVAFLNHGSYGATPRAVLVAQDEWRTRMERQPVRFMGRELPAAVRRAISPAFSAPGAMIWCLSRTPPPESTRWSARWPWGRVTTC
ncbi:MAG: hypothetical protein VCD33_14465 [Alphaproteobacteria bacterium]